MLQPTMGSMICSSCNAAYESLSKLREHQMVAHRGGGMIERPKAEEPPGEPESSEV